MGRNMVRLVGLVLALALVAPTAVWAAESTLKSMDTSGTGALFEIGMGARPLAMGGTFVATSDDENALFYNPAGLAYLQSSGLTSMYSTQYDVTKYGGAALAGKGYGLGALYLDASGIAGTGQNSEILDSFNYTSAAGLLGAAGNLGPIALGVRGKYLMQRSAQYTDGKLVEVTGQGAAGDAGVLLHLGPIGIGAVYENIVAMPVTYSNGTKENWEKRLSAGASLNFSALVLGADIENLNGQERYLHAGGELNLGPLSLRGGMSTPMGSATDAQTDELMAGADLTAGVGLHLGGLRIDYAFLMPKALPETHRLSLTLRF